MEDTEATATPTVMATALSITLPGVAMATESGRLRLHPLRRLMLMLATDMEDMEVTATPTVMATALSIRTEYMEDMDGRPWQLRTRKDGG